MDEEKTTIYEKLIEARELLYVLEVALDNDMQQTKDTTPFVSLVKLIRHKIADASDAL